MCSIHLLCCFLIFILLLLSGLALGIALTVYGREEEADTLIEQMTRDQDPIIRYGGMYALALAYRGTANNKAIRQLLHFAVSDVSDDVRRTAVLALGFVLYSEPEQVSGLSILKNEFFQLSNLLPLFLILQILISLLYKLRRLELSPCCLNLTTHMFDTVLLLQWAYLVQVLA